MNFSSKKERLDQLVSQQEEIPLSKAQAIIMAGQIAVDGKVINKSGTLIGSDQSIEFIPSQKYVSRGGFKLEGALDHFQIDPLNKTCLDVGSSTGGFTDCLLQRGASRVYAVDVGKAQLDLKLRKDERVVSIEETHIKDLLFSQISSDISLVVIDVSFISLVSVLSYVKNLVKKDTIVLSMVKPQFEVEPSFLRKGVVLDESVRLSAVKKIRDFSLTAGFKCEGESLSKLKGPKGNQEYFLY
ncbi:MAG: TlyA family RNA methyltransferase, partial [Elusimicrobiota bacterium]